MPRKTRFETDLRAAFSRHVSTESLDFALALIAGRAEPLDVPAAAQLERQCYNPPGHHHLLMTALNSLLGTHGCETVGPVDMRNGPPVEYLNAGDTYSTTLLWFRDLDSGRGRFRIGCMADAVEWCERKGIET